MGKILVITNRKGGCGKRFTTASLGIGLVRRFVFPRAPFLWYNAVKE